MATIELNNISKTYNKGSLDEVKALRDISLKIGANEVFFILGTNGSGKTTMINLINATDKPDSGEVLVGRVEVRKISVNNNARIFGRLFQNPKENVLPSYTVQENILLAMTKNKKLSPFRNLVSKNKIELANNFVAKYAPDLLQFQNMLAGKLSGGQMQIVGLMNMLISEPDVLLLDEFTSALDIRNTQKMLSIVKQYVLGNNRTCIIISHNIAHAFEFGTTMILLHKGRIAKQYSPIINTKEEVIGQFYRLDRDDIAD